MTIYQNPNEKSIIADEEMFTLNMISEKLIKSNRLEMYRFILEMVIKKSFETTLVNQIEKFNELENKDDLLREVTNEIFKS